MTKLDLEEFLPYRLNRLAAEISRQLRTVYADTYGLTVPEWRVFATLGLLQRSTAKEIGAHSAMHKTKVSRAVRALEERHWLVRQQNEVDRRAEYLALTAAGLRSYHKIVPEMLAFENRVLGKLGGRRADVLKAITLLEKVINLKPTR